jgi:hypothetical protein
MGEFVKPKVGRLSANKVAIHTGENGPPATGCRQRTTYREIRIDRQCC